MHSICKLNDNSADLTLEALATKAQWVAWQTEKRPDGKPTKVPYSPLGPEKARANDRATWGTLAEAAARSERLPFPYGLGGVGLELGPMKEGLALGGIDLDSCRDFTTGVVEPWALEIVEKIASYTEVSPSGTGIKVFFQYRADDLPLLRQVMGSEHGKQWKRGTEADHPPAIELHVSNRFFAFTGYGLPDFKDFVICEARTETLLWLIKEAGPEFAGGGKVVELYGGTDQSRSAMAMRVGAAAVREGAQFDQMCEAIQQHPQTADWYREKGEAKDKRELRRIWDKVQAASSGPR